MVMVVSGRASIARLAHEAAAPRGAGLTAGIAIAAAQNAATDNAVLQRRRMLLNLIVLLLILVQLVSL